MLKERILVTGVAGFIGSAVAKRFVEKGFEVFGIDNLHTGRRRVVPVGCEFIEAGAETIVAADFVKRIKPQHILHIGGQSSGEIGEESPTQDCKFNVLSTLNLLSAASEVGVRGFYLASSMGVYGNAQKVFNTPKLSEEAAGLPISVYGAGKWAAECYLKTYSNRKLDCVAMRMFNVYGPGQNMSNLKQGMVSIFLQQAMTSDSIVVKGALDRIRDFVFIDDVVDAWEALVDEKRDPGFLAMNLGFGIGHTVGDLLQAIQKHLGVKKIVLSESTPSDQSATIADINLIIEKLNWKPKYSLDFGIEKFCSWLKKNENLS